MDCYEITECIEKGKTKSKVTLDGEYTFQLYNSEVRRFHIKQGGLLSQESFIEIKDALYKRGLSRCLHLIKDRDYTQSNLEKKLRDGDYPYDVIERIIAKLQDEHFVNDGRYAKNYVVSYMNTKSKKQIVYALINKGISMNYIEAAFEDASDLFGNDIEFENVKKLLSKKMGNRNIEEFDYDSRMKIFAYVGRKGYEYELIRKAWDSLQI